MTPIPTFTCPLERGASSTRQWGRRHESRTMGHVQESLVEEHGEGEYPVRTALRARR